MGDASLVIITFIFGKSVFISLVRKEYKLYLNFYSKYRFQRYFHNLLSNFAR